MRANSPFKTRRLHTNSEDNIRVSERSIPLREAKERRARINTLPNEEEIHLRKGSLTKIREQLPPLSPPKLYETKLVLSSQAWAAYSLPLKKYRRGWRPERRAEFGGLLRLVVAKAWWKLISQHRQLKQQKVKVCGWALREEFRRSTLPLKEQQRLKENEKSAKRILAENTQIALADLVAGTLLSLDDQLFEYTTVFLGIVRLALDSSQELPFLLQTDNFEQTKAGLQRFVIFANQLLTESHLTGSVVDLQLSQELVLESTPLQMALLFADLIGHWPEFRHILEKKQHSAPIRFQMGYQFYEDRVKRFPNERLQTDQHLTISCRGACNFGVASFNKATGNIVILQDCKWSMAEVDVRRVEEWLAACGKQPQSKASPPSSSKLLPLLRLLQ